MKVNAAIASYFPTIPRNQEVASSKTPPVSASDKASPPSDESGIKRADFTNMTRNELRDWVNDQLRTGKMSMDESTPFVTMSISFSMDMKPVNMDTKVNFMELTRQEVQGALSRNDNQDAVFWQNAVNIMTKNQGLATGVNTTA